MTATQKQIDYALHLLDRAGYPTRYMSAQFRTLGATMREHSGTVSGWLEAMPRHRISRLISDLAQRR